MDQPDLNDDLPDNPEAAFVLLEREYRDICDFRLSNDEDDDRPEIYAQYVGRVSSAADELGIHDAPFVADNNNIDIDYRQFILYRQSVDNLVTRIRIRNAKTRQRHSVRLDANTKSKLRSLLEKIKEEIANLDVSTPKRDALFKKVSVLEEEINRDRTRWEVVGDLWIGLCERTGEGFEKLEQARKWIDSIAGLISQAKSLETPDAYLPKPDDPPKRLPRSKASDLVEDDIPF